MRFVQWQQAMLIVAPFVLLFVYVTWICLLVRQRSLRSVLLRLLVASAIFTAVWAAMSFALFIVAWMGTSDVTASYDIRVETHRASIGLPFDIFQQPLWHFQEQLPAWVFPWLWVPALPLFVALLVLGGLVALMQRLLSKSRFSIEQHGMLYARVLAGIAIACLAVFLWPQPSRNPEMPSVPIPNDAIAVRYDHTPDYPPRPFTTFTLEHISSRESQAYYQDALAADGWKLENSEASDAGSGMYSSTSLFSKDSNILEVRTAHGYETVVTIAEHLASASELAQVAALPKPTVTPIRNLTPPLPPAPTSLIPIDVPTVYP